MIFVVGEGGVNFAWSIIDKINKTETFSKGLLKSVFIAISKISGILDCSNYQTISLMSHTQEVLSMIILQIIMRRLLLEIANNHS